MRIDIITEKDRELRIIITDEPGYNASYSYDVWYYPNSFMNIESMYRWVVRVILNNSKNLIQKRNKKDPYVLWLNANVDTVVQGLIH